MKHLRKVHIQGQEWKFIVQESGGVHTKEARIYSPSKVMTRVKPEDISDFVHYDSGDGNRMFIITPGDVKNYIIKNLI